MSLPMDARDSPFDHILAPPRLDALPRDEDEPPHTSLFVSELSSEEGSDEGQDESSSPAVHKSPLLTKPTLLHPQRSLPTEAAESGAPEYWRKYPAVADDRYPLGRLSGDGPPPPPMEKRHYWWDPVVRVTREMWRPGDGDGDAEAERSTVMRDKLMMKPEQFWRFYQSPTISNGRNVIDYKQNMPPKYVLLDDLNAHAVLHSNIPKKFLVEFWPLDFSGQGFIRANRYHRGRAAIGDPDAEGDDRFRFTALRNSSEKYYFRGQEGYKAVTYPLVISPTPTAPTAAVKRSVESQADTSSKRVRFAPVASAFAKLSNTQSSANFNEFVSGDLASPTSTASRIDPEHSGNRIPKETTRRKPGKTGRKKSRESKEVSTGTSDASNAQPNPLKASNPFTLVHQAEAKMAEMRSTIDSLEADRKHQSHELQALSKERDDKDKEIAEKNKELLDKSNEIQALKQRCAQLDAERTALQGNREGTSAADAAKIRRQAEENAGLREAVGELRQELIVKRHRERNGQD